MFPVAHFPDGQIRPVFSSAQLEFIQQWLFAMGLTKEPIPLPSSEFLIRKEDMTICSPQLFNSADKLKGMIKVCIKFDPRVTHRELMYRARRRTTNAFVAARIRCL